MSDYMLRGIAANGEIRFFAANSKETVEYARKAHGLSPIASAALGRLLTAGGMMGAMMKNEQDLLTVKIDCQGPIKGLCVTADCSGHVKGYVKNPCVDLPSKTPGKLKVGDALDLGVLNVVRDTGLKEPYIGQTILQTGEIAEDLTYYFAVSEQTPSSVALGVLLTPENTVECAGGFILQVMPDATEETVSELERRIAEFKSVTDFLSCGKSIEEMMETVLRDMEPEIMEKQPLMFKCDCSRERTRGIISGLPAEELKSMIDDGKPIDVLCHFCGKAYNFTVEELEMILKEKG